MLMIDFIEPMLHNIRYFIDVCVYLVLIRVHILSACYTGLPLLPFRLNCRRRGFKHLGVYLWGDQTIKKNWEGVVEKVEGKLANWKWLLSQISYRNQRQET